MSKVCPKDEHPPTWSFNTETSSVSSCHTHTNSYLIKYVRFILHNFAWFSIATLHFVAAKNLKLCAFEVHRAIHLGFCNVIRCFEIFEAAGTKGNSTSDVFSSEMHRDVSAPGHSADRSVIRHIPTIIRQDGKIGESLGKSWPCFVVFRHVCSCLATGLPQFGVVILRCLTHLGIEHENGVVTGLGAQCDHR